MLHHCEKFIEYIKQQKFYEAHEILEELWYPKRKEKTPKVLVIKAFINASVAFELQKRGNSDGAIKVWNTYCKYAPLVEKTNEPILHQIKTFLDSYASTYLP